MPLPRASRTHRSVLDADFRPRERLALGMRGDDHTAGLLVAIWGSRDDDGANAAAVREMLVRAEARLAEDLAAIPRVRGAAGAGRRLGEHQAVVRSAGYEARHAAARAMLATARARAGAAGEAVNTAAAAAAAEEATAGPSQARSLPCNFAGLEVEGVDLGSASVSRLDTLAESQGPTQEACLLFLLGYLEQEEDAVRNVAATTRVFQARGNDEAAWILQSASQDYTPFYDAGIDGTGQTVGVGDTGLDEYSCYFFDDDAGDVVARTHRNTGAYDLTRRCPAPPPPLAAPFPLTPVLLLAHDVCFPWTASPDRIVLGRLVSGWPCPALQQSGAVHRG